MSKSKRWMAMMLAVLLACTLAACGAKPQPSSSAVQSSQPPVQSSQPQPQPADVLQPLPLATGFDALTGLARAEGMIDGQRPVAVMVSNNERSLPQRGLAAADVLVEMVTEGGITRLMALYSNFSTMPQVGPVRSTRDQFVQVAYPSAAIMVHIGTSVYARNLLDVLEEKDIDGLYLGRNAFWFDDVRGGPGAKLNEYCWFTDAGLVLGGMTYIDVLTVGEVRALFNFGTPAGGEAAAVVNAVFSDVSAASFDYQADSGLYNKNIFGHPHTDEDGGQLAYTNVFLLQCGITLKPDGLCTEFDLSEGTGYYFAGGRVQPVSWIKGGPDQALRLFDGDGKELQVATGKSYIGFVPNDREGAVSWQA